MATKKLKRETESRFRKKKRTMRTFMLASVMVALVGLLIFFFITLFDTLFPTTSGKGAALKKRDKVEVVLFFSDDNERFLVPEKRSIPKEASDEEQTKELVKALIDGSKLGHTNTFPKQADLLGVKIRTDGTAEANFGKSLPKNHPGSTTSEMATLYSLTNTLTTNIPRIKRVKVLIEGREVSSLKGHVDTRSAFVFQDMQMPGAQQ